MAKKRRNYTPRNHGEAVREIIKHLNRLTHCQHPNRIFRDWLSFVSTHLPDSPDTFTAGDYNQNDITEFETATNLLLAGVALGYADMIGAIYMQFASPNQRGAGQVFTPWEVASLMGRILVPDGQGEISQRLSQAAERAVKADPLVAMLFTKVGQTLAGLLDNAPLETVKPDNVSAETAIWSNQIFLQRILPAIAPWYEPIKVLDPCVGSGVLLLGVAECFPLWALKLGLVQFYGMDIDPLCVEMCRLNLRLYGLNGQWLRVTNALTATDEELAGLPEPAHTFYHQAREAHRNGDEALVAEYIAEANRTRLEMAGAPLPLLAPAVVPSGLSANLTETIAELTAEDGASGRMANMRMTEGEQVSGSAGKRVGR